MARTVVALWGIWIVVATGGCKALGWTTAWEPLPSYKEDDPYWVDTGERATAERLYRAVGPGSEMRFFWHGSGDREVNAEQVAKKSHRYLRRIGAYEELDWIPRRVTPDATRWISPVTKYIVALDPIVVIVVPLPAHYQFERPKDHLSGGEFRAVARVGAEFDTTAALVTFDYAFDYGTQLPFHDRVFWFSPDLHTPPQQPRMISTGVGAIELPGPTTIYLESIGDQWSVTLTPPTDTTASAGHGPTRAFGASLVVAKVQPSAYNVYDDATIHLAVQFGEVEGVAGMLAREPELLELVDQWMWMSLTPLQLAAFAGRTDMTDLLIERGAAMDAYTASALGHLDEVRRFIESDRELVHTWQGFGTPLGWACKTGQTDVARLLLEFGADPSARHAETGRTALHLAATSGRAATIQLLLDHGVDVEARMEDDEQTPLHLAATEGRIDLVTTLIENGANPNAKDWSDETPLYRAVLARNATLARLLLTHGADWAADQEAVQHIAMTNRPNLVELLLESELELDMVTACSVGDIDRVLGLLEADPSLSRKSDDNGSTPLVAALRNGRDDIARLLLDHGADPNATDARYPRLTPLYYAVTDCGPETVGLLLEQGADVSVPTVLDRSVLFYAATRGSGASVELLIEHGAAINEAATAAVLGRTQVVEDALEDDPKFAHMVVANRTLFCWVALSGQTEVLGLLLAGGAEVDRPIRPNGPGEATLAFVAGAGRIEVMKVLLEHGADVNGEPENWTTPLAAACRNGRLEVVELLIEHGADVEVGERMGQLRPLHLATVLNHPTVVTLLLEHGAKVNVRDWFYGRTPLRWADATGNNEVAAILREHGALP